MGISTHILDTTAGCPAAEVPVTLARMADGVWALINDAITDLDGRCKHLLPADQALHVGMYRIRFETETYFRRNHFEGLYPYVEIVFKVSSAERHYHIPLLLTPNGYTTYRGS
jgi:5-hydroxyisourate hydrolase